MKIRRVINTIIIILCLCIIIGVGAFIYNATNEYKINSSFTSVPLRFNPEDSSSIYQTANISITVYGGFVKGIQKDKDGIEQPVIRALSPLPNIIINNNYNSSISLVLENVNPDFYAKRITGNNLQLTKIAVNTLQLNIPAALGKTIEIRPTQPESAENLKYVILGDNRDGYNTFEHIIQQVNGEKPVFVIDNGDLVFSGKPNQYRLFDKVISNLSTTMLLTLGNHDIRGNGRETYTMLYGPPYYSFDFVDNHFVFLDSSPGWAEKRAISDEQYAWLEKDLRKAQGKHIYVITHIPPQDPRSAVTPNEIPNLVNKVKNGEGWVEQKLNNYNENKKMDHGFQDPEEAAKFEGLMSSYHVETVYLSHIHSNMDYYKDNVRYLISGGAGAELLTENSYYHYMITSFGVNSKITMVQLPSPLNNYLSRYAATIKLFTGAIYEENPIAVTFILIGLGLFFLILVIKFYLWKKITVNKIGKWIWDVMKYAANHFREIFSIRK